MIAHLNFHTEMTEWASNEVVVEAVPTAGRQGGQRCDG